MDNAKDLNRDEQYKELQQLLKNLGISTKHTRASEAEKKQASKLFPN